MGRITSKPISFKTSSVERISSHGFQLGCPVCTGALMLKDIWDGDQAYWCHTCNRGWRAGHLPPEARRIKAKALLEESLDIIPEPVIVEVKPLVKVKRQKEPKPVILEPEAVIIEPKLTTKKQKVIPELAKPEPELIVRSRKVTTTLILEPELIPIRKSRVSQPVPIFLDQVVTTRLPKVKAADLVLEPEPVVKMRSRKKEIVILSVEPEPSKAKLTRKAIMLEPVLATIIPALVIPAPTRKPRRPKVTLEPITPEPVTTIVKKPKIKPVLLEPVPAQPEPRIAIIPSKARALRSALAHAAQQDLFA